MNQQEDSFNNYPPALFAVLLLFLSVHTVLAFKIGSPILGSDEYAYFILGKYFDSLDSLKKLHALDPWLQQIHNYLFFKKIHILNQFFGSGATGVLRVVHLLEIILAALLLYVIFLRFSDSKTSFLGLIAFLLFPSTIYLYSVLPEIDLILLAIIIGYALIIIFPRNQIAGAALTGSLLGVSLFIKPHAVAIILAAIMTIFGAYLLGVIKGRLISFLCSSVSLALGCFFAMVFMWGSFSSSWSTNLSSVLGLDFYGRYLKTGENSGAFISKIFDLFKYSFAHSVVVILIFTPAIIWIVCHIVKLCKDRTGLQSIDATVSIATLYALFMLIFHIGMASYFTAGAGILSTSEAMRLHGRYLGPALSFLPFFYFFSLKTYQDKYLRVLVFISIFSFIFFYYVLSSFKIFPWDYPLLFSFFKEPNHYGWNYKGDVSALGPILFACLGICLIIAAFFKRARRPFYYSQLFVILVIGTCQTYSWSYRHTSSNGATVSSARTLADLIGTENPGQGVFVSDDRYGRASYALFGLANAPKVLIRDPGNRVSAEEVSGADWVLFDNEYLEDFPFATSVSAGSFTFFPINVGINIYHPEKARLEVGHKCSIFLGTENASVVLKGFNEQEQWGAWTSLAVAEISLPVKAQGEIELDIFGWTLAENLGNPVKFSIGDSVTEFFLSERPEHHKITLRVSETSDLLRFWAPTTRPENSSRDMGIAIGSVVIRAVDK